jgi:NAD(P)-dependent dehydrogenase (short-subunit alcohol dehydrogenase family)
VSGGSVWAQVARPADGVAWITGASAGIGRATALALADRGWEVHATARNVAALDALAAERPGRIVPRPCDVADRAAMAALVASIEADRPIALAILNAGIYLPMRAQEFDAGVVERTFAINLLGVANGLDPLLKRMIARRSGQIAVTASVAGYRGLPRAAAYGATKAALIAMAESLAFDLIDLGVRLSVINPGFVETEATAVNDFEMPFLIGAEAAARRIVEGLERPGFEIAFPRRFELILKTLGLLPNRAYFAVMRKAMGWGPDVR